MLVKTEAGIQISFTHTDGKSLFEPNGTEWVRVPEKDNPDKGLAAYGYHRDSFTFVMLTKEDLKRVCKGDKAMNTPTTVAEMRDYSTRMSPKARALVDEWTNQSLREILMEAEDYRKDPGTLLEQIAEKVLEEQEARNRPPEPQEAPREATKKVDSHTGTRKRSRAREGLPVASEGVSVVLTPKQVEFMERMSENPGWEEKGINGEYIVSLYAAELSDTMNPMSVGAVLTTLREKGLVKTQKTRYNGSKECLFSFTDDGVKIYTKLSQKGGD